MKRKIIIDNNHWVFRNLDFLVLELVYDCLTSSFKKHPHYDIKVLKATEKKKYPFIEDRNDKKSNDPTTIYLAIDDLSYWCQTIFQFSHELCHMLTNYENSRNYSKFKWFEEAICGTASIFVLEKLEQEWSMKHPQKQYIKNIKQYKEKELKKYKEINLAKWFKKNRLKLEHNSCVKDNNNIRLCNKMVWTLIKVFRYNPQFWEECGYLGEWDIHNNKSFESYIESWASYTKKKTQKKALLPQSIKEILNLKIKL